MDMDIDLESSPSTAAPSCCSRCKQQCFQDTTSIALTAPHHFLTIFNNNHYIPLHTITYHYIPLLCGHIDLFFVDIGGKLWNKVHRDHPWPSVTIRDHPWPFDGAGATLRLDWIGGTHVGIRGNCALLWQYGTSAGFFDQNLWDAYTLKFRAVLNGGFPKWGYPRIHLMFRIFHSKPAIGDSGISHWNWVQHQVTRHWSLRWNPLWWLSILGCAVCILLGHGFHAAVCQSGPVRSDEPLGHQGPILGPRGQRMYPLVLIWYTPQVSYGWFYYVLLRFYSFPTVTYIFVVTCRLFVTETGCNWGWMWSDAREFGGCAAICYS